MGWLWFSIVQLLMLTATVVGCFLLIPCCLAQAWIRDAKSTKDGRAIDRWSFQPFNWIWGNPEDGVSGQTALVWLDGSTQGPYMPDAYPAWRAYCWSAWRNSANNLKYVFAWHNGPYLQTRWLSAGWKDENGYTVPVLSLFK